MITYKEEKALLLKDLCARLPYGVKANMATKRAFREVCVVKTIYLQKDGDAEINGFALLHQLLPFLRPMSSMTHSEYNEYLRIKTHGKPFEVIDWLNARHIDYRKLIEKGLAIAVNEENNPYK